jgi:hypothetical protein
MVQEILDSHLTHGGVFLLGSVDTLYLSNYTARVTEQCLWYEKNKLTAPKHAPSLAQDGGQLIYGRTAQRTQNEITISNKLLEI